MSASRAGLAAAWPAPREREPVALELVAFFCLSAFVAARYASLIASPPTLRVVIVAACVTLGCGLLAASGRLTGSGAAATTLRIALVAGPSRPMLLLRIPAHLMAPEQWSRLADRLSGGLDESAGSGPTAAATAGRRPRSCCRSRRCCSRPAPPSSGRRGQWPGRAACWR